MSDANTDSAPAKPPSSDNPSRTPAWVEGFLKRLRTPPLSAPSPPAAPEPPDPAPTFEIDQEVRFAVVMYGGVSLAIYMNGIAEELLRVVRATAAAQETRAEVASLKRKDSTAVYRTVARMLSCGGEPRRLAEVTASDPIRARFVVDILSGTSAGGLNAVFLAKALATGGSLDHLKALWFSEADVDVLLNDSRSIKYVEVDKPAGRFPRSLLNGRRMYRELLAALAAMDTEGRPALVDEVDLFVTATDLAGLPIELQLHDKLVDERRHKTVFRFAYRSAASLDATQNDFIAANTPFLAFAARATSAFPIAFEPMRLADTAPAIALRYDRRARGEARDWRQFFPDYLPEAGARGIRVTPTKGARKARDPETEAIERFATRPFADGGYLDNKPFEHAIREIGRRRAKLPIDRKLLFLDPNPELVTDRIPKPEEISFLDNAAAALTGLPRYETIREDLERILEHNRSVERFRHITEAMEHSDDSSKPVPVDRDAWAKQSLAYGLQTFGPSYGGYHRLKVGQTTTELARLVTDLQGLDQESDDSYATRFIVRHWRMQRYDPYPAEGGAKASENSFLVDFDQTYRVRRIRFVAQKLERLAAGKEMPQGTQPTSSEQQDLKRRLGPIRASLHEAEKDLVAVRLSLLSPTGVLAAALGRVRLFREDLRPILAASDEAVRDPIIETLLRTRVAAPRETEGVTGTLETVIDDMAVIVRGAYVAAFDNAAEKVLGALAIAPADSPFVRAGLLQLRSYYASYEVYDQVLFPAMFTSPSLGEMELIDVVRISPRDAVGIVDEAGGRRKLASTSVMNFGGFLLRDWRINDRLWGRLDGAERIITALLPSNDPNIRADREVLIRQAHEAILREEHLDQHAEELFGLLRDKAKATPVPEEAPERRALLDRLLKPDIADHHRRVLEACVSETVLAASLARSLPESYSPPPTVTVPALSRSARIVGEMFEGLARERGHTLSGPGRWLINLTRLVWGMVEIAMPNRLAHALAKRWLAGLYLFVGLLLLSAFVLGAESMIRLGWLTLLAIVGVHVGTLALSTYIAGKGHLIVTIGRFVLAVVVLTVLALASLGGWYAFELFQDRSVVIDAAETATRDPRQRLGWTLGIAGVVLTILFATVLTLKAVSFFVNWSRSLFVRKGG